MNYPLLENIDKYVRENGIGTQEVYVSTKRLPRALIEAATKEISKDGIEYKIDDLFIVTYDNNGNLALVLTFNNSKTNLLITDTLENLDFPNKNFKFTRIKSNKIFSKAKRIEWIEKKIYLSYEKLYDSYLKKYEDYIKMAPIEEDKRKGEHILFKKKNELKNILKDQIELLLNSDEMNIDFNYNSIFDSQLEKLENVIEQYISYINNETIKRNQEQSQSDIVYFVPEETDGNVRRNGAPKEVHPEEHERKNNVMATDYRDSVINGLKPIKTKIAMSSVKVKTYDGEEFEEDIDSIYTCSLVSLGNNEYKLIMEPFNGIRYTKIAYFVFEGEMTDEELNDIIKKYVSLNTEHILNSNNIIRIGHTSTNAFMNSVWYAVLKDNRLKCRKYFIEKVNNMVPEVIERQKNL